MSKRDGERSSLSTGMSDVLANMLESAARFLVTVGLIAFVIGVGALIYTYFILGSNASAAETAQAHSNIGMFGTAALLGALAASIGISYLNWGEETVGPLELIVGGAMFFAPFYLPLLGGAATTASTIPGEAIGKVQTAGIPIIVVGVLVVLADVLGRIRLRSREGSRPDLLKYGKGIREDKDIRNVLMGKCWQLPYCRKFVRERCPIYHARRTCWRERVGCMCEESVIQNAMAGKVIPSEAVAAAKFIPVNTKLSPELKAERCRQCVIFNEHQRHKYRVALPGAVAVLAAFYFLFHGQLITLTSGILFKMDSVIGRATYRDAAAGTSKALTEGTIPFPEILLACLAFIALAYILRLIEYLIFQLKV